jgi:hypothetical protein
MKEKHEEKNVLLKSMKKGVRSGSIIQMYGSAPKCHRSPTLTLAHCILFKNRGFVANKT